MIDLHIHTNKSDGVLTPIEVIDEALKNNVKYISITDHDTIEAYNNDLFEYASTKGITLIPGVEISTKTKKCGIHVLGYNIDLNNESFINELKNIRNSRHDYLMNVSQLLNDLGYLVNTKELDKIDSVTKAHIASDVINNPLNYDLLNEVFGFIPSKGEFIETIMNEGCPAYTEKKSITPEEASKLIKGVGGKVVLAHPVAYSYEDNLTEDDIQNIINEMKPDGIETYYIYVDRYNIKHNDIDKWLAFTNKNNLFSTIGSDYHNDDILRPKIGLINENIIINEDDIVKKILY